jgi:hypothetical protein
VFRRRFPLIKEDEEEVVVECFREEQEQDLVSLSAPRPLFCLISLLHLVFNKLFLKLN